MAEVTHGWISAMVKNGWMPIRISKPAVWKHNSGREMGESEALARWDQGYVPGGEGELDVLIDKTKSDLYQARKIAKALAAEMELFNNVTVPRINALAYYVLGGDWNAAEETLDDG